MTTNYDLPYPSDNELNRSLALSEVLKNKIKVTHSISFDQYMREALYHPTLGYYEADTFTLGKAGDFTTAPQISPLFAQCFAKQCTQIFAMCGSDIILELGAGTGQFASDILAALHELQTLPKHYYIYEISKNLRLKQQQFLQETCPMWMDRITWLDALPSYLSGVVIANEVLDALPFQCFSLVNGEIKERRVTWENESFTWQLSPATSSLLEKVTYLRDEYGLANDYASEINFEYQPLLQSLSAMLTNGVVLLSDYGYGGHEYYRRERNRGTLTCFYKHRSHDNPFIFPGLQDITAHVDFTNVIESATASGFTLAGFTTQAGFLLSTGLTELTEKAEKNLSSRETFSLHQGIKYLTLPDQMGERVKVMALAKNLDDCLLGFSLQDRRRDL